MDAFGGEQASDSFMFLADAMRVVNLTLDRCYG